MNLWCHDLLSIDNYKLKKTHQQSMFRKMGIKIMPFTLGLGRLPFNRVLEPLILWQEITRPIIILSIFKQKASSAPIGRMLLVSNASMKVNALPILIWAWILVIRKSGIGSAFRIWLMLVWRGVPNNRPRLLCIQGSSAPICGWGN